MERSNGSKSLFALDPRTGWQKNASRREVRGVHNRSGVYPDPSNCRDRLLCSVPTTERQWMATTFLLVYQRSRPAARRFIAPHGMAFFVVPSNTRYHPQIFFPEWIFLPEISPTLVNCFQDKEPSSHATNIELLRNRRFVDRYRFTCFYSIFFPWLSWSLTRQLRLCGIHWMPLFTYERLKTEIHALGRIYTLIYFIRVCSNHISIYRSPENHSLSPEKRLKHAGKEKKKEETKSVQALIFLAI